MIGSVELDGRRLRPHARCLPLVCGLCVFGVQPVMMWDGRVSRVSRRVGGRTCLPKRRNEDSLLLRSRLAGCRSSSNRLMIEPKSL